MNYYSKIFCFCSRTEIITSSGIRIIEQIKPNDIVISYNQNLGITEEVRVERTAISMHSMIAKITFKNNNSVKCTIDHPFWVVGKGWCSIIPVTSNENYDLQVNQLLIDDKCIFFDNHLFSEVKITHIGNIFGDFKMYIISGGTNHCFFANGILVHDENLQNLKLTRENVEISDSKVMQNLI
ncbi:MAG: hypothetical protein IH950_10695 [Bacteroidetes bacterium]|nr:hypothetical protein [Bacteroidota bacterium]